MVAAVGSINPLINGKNSLMDAEYIAILQELRGLGLSSVGNKEGDKARLEQAKTELIQRIQTKNNEEERQALQVQPLEGVNEIYDPARAQLEESRLGAMTVAQLNKIYFGLA